MVTTDNERRILSAMSRIGPLTKGDLIEHLDLSWATVVKLVNRMVDSGLLVKVGTAERELPVGKNSYLYDLSASHPVAVGVDVEYALTRLVAANIRGEVIASRTVVTKPGKSIASLVSFLRTAIASFLDDEVEGRLTSEGIGIGLPAFIIPFRRNIYDEVGRGLAPFFSIPVRVDNNVRAYTLYCARRVEPPGDFIMTTIRTGVGCGLFLRGEIYRGEGGLSGEISHLKVAPGGLPCRCGTRGCLETVVNENLLYEKAVTISALQAVDLPSAGDRERKSAVLDRLFVLAKEGDPQALEIVQEAARWLSLAYATLLVTFDVHRIYVSGHFGRAGGLLASHVQGELKKLVDKRFGHEVSYRPIDDAGFVLGAAYLALNNYLVPLGSLQ